jgi:hypothetical protein
MHSLCKIINMKDLGVAFEVLTVVTVKSSMFWDMMLLSVVEVCACHLLLACF